MAGGAPRPGMFCQKLEAPRRRQGSGAKARARGPASTSEHIHHRTGSPHNPIHKYTSIVYTRIPPFVGVSNENYCTTLSYTCIRRFFSSSAFFPLYCHNAIFCFRVFSKRDDHLETSPSFLSCLSTRLAGERGEEK